MENILTIKERILSFLESQGIKKVDFFEATGIQSSNFKGKNMSSQPGGDMIVRVLTIYPNLSAEWLLRGEGDMLKSPAIKDKPKIIKTDTKKDNDLPSSILDKFLTTIQGQAEEIGELKARIKDLEQRLGKTAGDANIGGTANAG
ncbi:hypothetical protein [Bacteroides finegoldii]|uniref:hypothetical protein n=1 Tax=Bacteroides finegoldii TaxID=338188 RepID=UPI0022E4EF8F|nr:hypothetical protein [Bacteroides finegoldii]